MHSKLFVINLSSSKDRLDCCNAEFLKAGLGFERIEAIDGSRLSSDKVDDVYQWQKSDYYKELSTGEIACYLSHRKVWQKILDDNLDFAIVCEDDISVSRTTASAIEAIASISQAWDCVKLAEFPIKREVLHSSELTGHTSAFQLVTYGKVPNRTCAQAISRQGAEKLLRYSEQILRPVDVDMQYWWEKNLNIFGLQPYPIKVNIGQKSTIDVDGSRKTSKRSVWRQIMSKYHFIKNNKRALHARLSQLNGH